MTDVCGSARQPMKSREGTACFGILPYLTGAWEGFISLSTTRLHDTRICQYAASKGVATRADLTPESPMGVVHADMSRPLAGSAAGSPTDSCVFHKNAL